MKSQIIIVGGGILGLAHAYHLLEAGQQVTLLEKNNPLQGSSVRNFGQIVPSGFSDSGKNMV
ncbi:MAG TPA: FAD-dependent oxidoreductase [Saprospiraceae bacterium]|nr:FAD-dependent oxidoreductase [Saprospiraceae bacterium]